LWRPVQIQIELLAKADRPGVSTKTRQELHANPSRDACAHNHEKRVPARDLLSSGAMNDTSDRGNQRDRLRAIARRAMKARGLAPEFSREALAEVDRIVQLPPATDASARDLRGPPWCSCYNADPR